MHVPESLAPLAELQHGVVSRQQLLAAGVSRHAVRWSLGRTAHLVLPGVVALFTGPTTPYQRLVAARLLAGPEAVLASLNAARWHGLLDVPDDGLVRMLVPAERSARRVGFVVVRRTWRPAPRPWARGPLLISPPVRALVDSARELRDQRAADAMIVTAVQKRRVRIDDLRAELESGPVRGSAGARAAVRAAATGAWSVPELDMLIALARSTVLPRVWPNPELSMPDGTQLPTPDGWVDDVGLALQMHSRTYHARDDDWEGTVEGDTALGEVGAHVLGVTPSSLSRDPGRFVRRAENAYGALVRSARRRPDVVMTPRGAGVVLG